MRKTLMVIMGSLLAVGTAVADHETLTERATHTLERFHPKLILEVVQRQLANMGTSVDELEAFVRSLGYHNSRQIDRNNREYTVN